MSKQRAILVYKAKADPRTVAGDPREIYTIIDRKEQDDE